MSGRASSGWGGLRGRYTTAHQSASKDRAYLEWVESCGDDPIKVQLLQEVNACSGPEVERGVSVRWRADLPAEWCCLPEGTAVSCL